MGFFSKLKKIIGIKPKSKSKKKQRKKIQPIEIKEDYRTPQTSISKSEAEILANNRKKRRRALLEEKRNG